jgi:diguanylate cyclase (GGDEF)-like protein
LRTFKLEMRGRTADEKRVMRTLIDELTGLPNREGWELMLGREEARCARYGSAAAVLALALDADAAGDDLVLRAAIALSSVLRPSDVIARMGATAFAVLLVECDRATAVGVCQRIERELAAAAAPASVGVASRGRGVPLQAAADAAGAALDVRRRERQA